MKVILTGATGFIGGEILTQLLASPTVTSVIAITRRALPVANPKLQNILLDDFNAAWPASVLDACAGASACIWALGLASIDLEKNKVINRDYTLAGFHALKGVSAADKGQRMRFVYTSGILAEKDQGKQLWFVAGGRKLRGEVENQLVALGKEHSRVMETYVTRPAMVQRKDAGFVLGTLTAAGGLLPSIKVDELAAATIGIAMDGGERQIWENAELARRGRELLSGRA